MADYLTQHLTITTSEEAHQNIESETDGKLERNAKLRDTERTAGKMDEKIDEETDEERDERMDEGREGGEGGVREVGGGGNGGGGRERGAVLVLVEEESAAKRAFTVQVGFGSRV